MTGELYIGGVGVAEGYIGRPELTSDRFLPNSFHPGRMYRTGDLVRFMTLKPWGEVSGIRRLTASNIVLEFLGRRDSQVKVRGYRVELVEIELAFLKQPGIQAASVLALTSEAPAARADDSGQPGGPRQPLGGCFASTSHLCCALKALLGNLRQRER